MYNVRPQSRHPYVWCHRRISDKIHQIWILTLASHDNTVGEMYQLHGIREPQASWMSTNRI